MHLLWENNKRNLHYFNALRSIQRAVHSVCQFIRKGYGRRGGYLHGGNYPILGKRKELPADTNIPGYILTTVKNKSLNHLRHQTIRTDVEDQLYDHRQRELNFRISSLESCDPSDLFTVEVKEIIRKTLNELPEQTRAIFFKSRYESKTNREIAAELEVSIKTVEFHISKALKLFRSRLKDYLPVLLVLTGISDF